MRELGQNSGSPDWRPVLNVHSNTLFGVLEETILSVSHPVLLSTLSLFPFPHLLRIVTFQVPLKLKCSKLPSWETMIVELLLSIQHSSTSYCSHFLRKHSTAPNRELSWSVLLFDFAFVNFLYFEQCFLNHSGGQDALRQTPVIIDSQYVILTVLTLVSLNSFSLC